MDRPCPLPPLSALRAFEAAARLASFTRAATELGLTQSAISHQVRALEDRLGTPLFTRDGKALIPTEAARTLLPFVREALQSLRTGVDAVAARHRGSAILTVSVSPNFAAKWLVPRLGRFTAAHPDLDLRIGASARHVDFASEGVDMAVRHGDGNWPHLDALRLCAEEIFPVCSPALLREAPLATPGDLARHVLIHERDTGGWRRWLDQAGIPGIDATRGPVLSDASLAIDAAVAAQGVALARSALVSLDLAAGRLLRPLPHALPAPFSYWIVRPRGGAVPDKVARFRTWLIEQAAADRPSP